MVFFLYGNDSYRRENKLRDLIAPYSAKYKDTDMLFVDLEEGPDLWSSVCDFFSQPSMFVDSKVVVVKNATLEKNKKWLSALKRELESKKTFVFISEKDKPPKDFLFLTKKPAQVLVFGELNGAELEKFLLEEAKTRNVFFENQAWKFFVSFVSTQTERSWFGVRELEKLQLFSKNKPIVLDELRAITPFYKQEDFFSIINLFKKSKTKIERLAYIERLFAKNESAAKIFNMLAFNVYGKDLLSYSNFDVLVKSGKLDYEEVLVSLALS